MHDSCQRYPPTSSPRFKIAESTGWSPGKNIESLVYTVRRSVVCHNRVMLPINFPSFPIDVSKVDPELGSEPSILIDDVSIRRPVFQSKKGPSSFHLRCHKCDGE